MMAEEKIAAPETNEIATTRDGRDITRGFVDGLPLLPPQDKLLLLKGGGDLKIYQEVLRDEQVKTCLGQRFSSVISKAWGVKPGGTKLIDKKAAEFIRQQIDNLKFDHITEKMLYGVFYGYAVAEAIVSTDGNTINLDDLRVRDRRRFGFAPDMSLRLKTMANPFGEPLPPNKFWYFCNGADHDDEPYGLGLAHWLYWPVFFKRSGIKFWLKFLEKFGTPTAQGTYQQGTDEAEQDKLLNALRDIHNDSAVIVPEGMTVTLLEATRSGAADYESMVKVMDDAIAKVILGQTGSTQATPGRLGNDQLQSDVRNDIVKADADLICMSLNSTVVRWLTDWNFNGAAYPLVWRDVEEPEDLDKRADRDTKIAQLGFKASLSYIQDTYGGDWSEATPTDLGITPGFNNATGAADPAQQNNSASFAEIGQSATGQLEDDLVKHSSGSWESTVKTLQGIVDKAPDLTTLQKQLTAQFADMGETNLVNIMAAAFALAELKGISDIQDEGNA